MANVNAYPSKQLGLGIVKLDFCFNGNDASDIDPTTIHGDMGMVASIVHTGAGAYTLTFVQPWRKVLGLIGSSQSHGTYPGGTIEAVAVSNEGTQLPLSITIVASTAGTPTNLPSGSKFFISIVFQDDPCGTR